MANKRQTKKYIKNICGELATECVLAMQYVPNIDTEKIRGLINEAIELQVSSLKHMTIVFDKSPRDFQNKNEYKAAKEKYFKTAYIALAKEFNAKVLEIVDGMNKAVASHK